MDGFHARKKSFNSNPHDHSDKMSKSILERFRLDDRVALITGAGQGIGKAFAIALGEAGAKVAIADMRAELADQVSHELEEQHIQAFPVTANVADPQSVEAMVRKVIDHFGALHIAFNNAGIEGASALTHECTEENWNKVIATDLTGVWLCMKYELLQMVAQGGGAIVNTASIAGLIGLPTSSAYVAAKHGVVGLTKTAAIEYAGDNVRVNAVCPGYIETNMTKDAMQRRGDQIMSMVPFHRMGRPEEIAEMVVWLCSDRASRITSMRRAPRSWPPSAPRPQPYSPARPASCPRMFSPRRTERGIPRLAGSGFFSDSCPERHAARSLSFRTRREVSDRGHTGPSDTPTLLTNTPA